MTSKLKVAYVLSYKDPKYVRTRALLSALEEVDNTEIVRVINSRTNFIRYGETIAKLIFIRITKRPDIYILGFRGHEIVLPVRLLTIGKPLIYDEFFDPLDWLFVEHEIIKRTSLVGKFVAWYYQLPLKRLHVITDTSVNARHSEIAHKLKEGTISDIPVSTDEDLFDYRGQHDYSKNRKLRVFFYTNGQKLHGTRYILQAIKDTDGVRLHLVGGGNKIKNMISELEIDKKTKYEEHLAFEELPNAIGQADLCIGGPFGATRQAERVITGKTFQFIAMGKPTIIGNNRESSLFSHRKDSFIVAQASSDAIRNEIEWARDNRDKLSQIGENARKLYDKKFSRKVVSRKMEKLISSISSLK